MALPKPKQGEPTATIYPGPLYLPVEVPAEYAYDMKPQIEGGLSYEELKAKWYHNEKPKPKDSKKSDERPVRHRPDCPSLKQAGKELVNSFTNFFSF